MKKQLLIVLGLQIVSTLAFSFPEMIRHGYSNCTACHVSTAGGGVLNAYGRSLSKELISTWSGDQEEGILHGAIDTSKVDDWLALGGDIRGVQVHQENEQVRRGRWVNMQASFEAAIVQPRWSVVASVGQYIKPNEWKEYASRYFAQLMPVDGLYLKAGRFLPNFGINLPDHILSTRGALQFGYGQEKDTAEVSWLGADWNIIASAYKAPRQLSNLNLSGASGVVTYTFLDNHKVGVQHLSEKDDLQKRQVSGVLGYLGWNKKMTTLIELDEQKTQVTGTTERKGYALMQRTSYELYKGLQAVFLNDYFQADHENGSTKDYKYGPGVQWFPRPHFDLQLFWTREQLRSMKEGDYAWLALHYYL